MVLSINLFEAADTLTGFMNSHGYSLPVLMDAHYGTSMLYGVSGIPITFFIDKSGVIRHIKRGAYSNLAELQRDLAIIA